MKPAVDFKVLDWAGDGLVIKVQLFGTDHRGDPIDKAVAFLGVVTIAEVHEMVAKINNGSFRP